MAGPQDGRRRRIHWARAAICCLNWISCLSDYHTDIKVIIPRQCEHTLGSHTITFCLNMLHSSSKIPLSSDPQKCIWTIISLPPPQKKIEAVNRSWCHKPILAKLSYAEIMDSVPSQMIIFNQSVVCIILLSYIAVNFVCGIGSWSRSI